MASGRVNDNYVRSASWALVLDMDGVIVDTEPLYIRVDALVCRELGVDVEEAAFERCVGQRAPEMWAELRERFDLPATVDELLARAAALHREAVEAGESSPPVPGALELIRDLHRRRIPVAVASSTSAAAVDRVLDRVGVRELITARVGGDQVLRAKPDPEIYLRAAGEIGLPPARCVAIEDSVPGVASARAAGMACVGLRNPRYESLDLSHATVVVESLVGLDAERLAQLVPPRGPDD